MTTPQVGVFIGRFEPLHVSHLDVIRSILSKVDYLVLILGSDCKAKSIKNPWTTAERVQHLRACLTREEWGRVTIVPAKDYESDLQWVMSVQAATLNLDIAGFSLEYCRVTLYGHDKDQSTRYLSEFPKWGFQEVGKRGPLAATLVRALWFSEQWEALVPLVPPPVFEALKADSLTDTFRDLQAEYLDIMAYRASWVGTPFPVIFQTVDAVVIKSGHVLVVRRRGRMGKGLIALPGGFLNQAERLLDGCLRELREETRIKLSKEAISQTLVGQHTFDAPDRSLRGRTITTAFCFNLGSGELPRVEGDDDADKAWWMSLRDVNRQEESFFEDHFYIIQHFISKF